MNELYGIAGYNEAKTEILDTIQKLGEATTREIALITNKRCENASILCLQYHRHGLLARRRMGRAYSYSLTERGVERLDWLRAGEA